MTIHAHHESRAAVLDVVPRELLIGGRWVPAASSAVFSVLDPGTGDILADVADASPADGLLALDAAVEAAAPWAATAPRTRSDILRTVFDLLRERRDHFALLMTLEMGKPLNEAHGEVDYGAEFLRWFSEEAVRIDGRFGDTPERNGRMVVTRRPVGPCYLITPWNFPLAMATRKIAPALAAGCTVVVKPAEATPLTTLYLARLFEEAGLPPGVLNIITTSSSAAVSEPIISDKRLRKLSFTGSTAVGRVLSLAPDTGHPDVDPVRREGCRSCRLLTRRSSDSALWTSFGSATGQAPADRSSSRHRAGGATGRTAMSRPRLPRRPRLHSSQHSTGPPPTGSSGRGPPRRRAVYGQTT